MKTYYQTDAALGTQVHMALVTDREEGWAEDLLRQLWLELLLFEKRCSRFITESELSQFNRSAGSRAYTSPEFGVALAAAKRMGIASGGLYNPFVLPALQRAGYKQSLVPEYSTDEVDDHSHKRIASVETLEIGEGWARIPYGTAIDLGGCGKGLIADLLADRVDIEQGIAGYWFSIGGDVMTCGYDEQGEPWRVSITPHITDISVQERIAQAIAPSSARFAVATSTVNFRKGVHGGKEWHHIIDPRTGRPSDTNVSLATVCNASLLEADVYASCAIIVGYPNAKNWLERHGCSDSMVQYRAASIDDSAHRTAPKTEITGQCIKKWL